ncbi:MAG: VWA domain-containing protein [Paludibacteraceae bacterium]|nr:VWA domain-containing protein [Paludibacteraceae bacterium]
MKQILSLCLALLCLSTANACVKKQSPITRNEVNRALAAENNQSPITLIVMDTTQALLYDAQVKVGKTTYKTSFDGRIVLQPEQLAGVKSLLVSCADHNDQKVTLDDRRTLIVRLTPKPRKTPSDKEVYYSLGMTRRGEVAKASAVYAVADDAVAEMAMTDDAVVMEETAERPHILPAYGGANTNVSAGKLTAGEVNDFTKWYFWPKVLDGTHKQFVSEWRIAPRERYTVQVMNQAGYPVANYPVNLTDRKGNTVFQTVTDNTGKAELWNGLIGPRADIIEPQKTIIVDEPCSGNPSSVTGNPSDVDVVFVFDATGSMGDELRYLQAEMKDVIARASAATGGLDIRTGAVVYRDHGDEYITRLSRLTDDIKTTQAFIDKQQANGGGDYPEAVPEALMAALNSAGWNESARARIAFLILDAPCHQDSATLALLHDQILNAAAQGIRIVPVVCSGLGESGEFLLRAMALATNGTSFFLTDDSGIGHTHLKPTTDSLKVEHLNDMLVRTIVEFSYMPPCEITDEQLPITDDSFLPNPFTAQELEADPTIPHGEGVHYLLDVSGKLLGIFEGEVKTDQLPIGVYFIKTFYNGQWFTKKILVR